MAISWTTLNHINFLGKYPQKWYEPKKLEGKNIIIELHQEKVNAKLLELFPNRS